MADSLVSIGADLSELRKQLAAVVPEGGKAAAKVLNDLSKAIGRAEAAATRAAAEAAALNKQTRAGTDAWRGNEQAVGKTKESLASLGAALSVVSPEMGSVVTQTSALSGALKAAAAGGPIVATALAAIATVAGTGYIAWRAYNEESERAAAIAAEVSAAEKARAPIVEALRKATLDLAVATGQMTDEARKLEDAGQSAWRAYQDGTEETRKRIAELRKEQASLTTQLVDQFEKRTPEWVKAWSPVSWAIRGTTSDSAELGTEIDALNAEVSKSIAITGKLADVTKDVVKADERAKEAKDAATKATKDQAAALAALMAQEEARAQSEEQAAVRSEALRVQAAHVAAAANAATISGLDTVTAREQEALAELDRIYRQRFALAQEAGVSIPGIEAELEAQRTQIAEQAEQERTRIRTEEAAKQADAAKQAAAQAIAAWTSNANQLGGYLQQGLAMVGSAAEESSQVAADSAQRLQDQLIAGEEFYTATQKAALAARVKAQQDAAKKAWETAKAAKVAEAFASTALAAINAIAQSPPPSPFGIIGATIATAAGLASVAQIQSQNPTFHSGGSPDEIPATLTRKEYVSSPVGRSVLGERTLRRADAGIAPQPAVYAVSVYRHDRVVTKWKGDGLRMGDPIDQAIRRSMTSIYGHRS
jgi:hypothetical protein